LVLSVHLSKYTLKKEATINAFRVDPIAIANKHNIEVVANPFLDVDGMIEKKEDGSVVITYNNTTHPNRQRFTIAHELGHYFKGHLNGTSKKLRDPSKNFTKDNFDIHEVEANRFAASLLMPKETIEHLIFEKGYDITQTAKILEVSTGALVYRLENLGILK